MREGLAVGRFSSFLGMPVPGGEDVGTIEYRTYV